MKGLRATLLDWTNQRLSTLLEAPRMFGSDEAIEMQALLLLELKALVLQPEREIANPRRVFDIYTTYLNRTYPRKPNRPLFEIVERDDFGLNLAKELHKFLDAFTPTLLEENPFEHNTLAIQLRFKPDQLPTAAAVTGYYEEFRRAARSFARRPGTTSGRVSKDVENATDFELADLRLSPKNGAPAEALLLLGGGVGQQSTIASELVRSAMSSMISMGEWAGTAEGVERLPVDDVGRRTHLALQTLRILPRGEVAEVGIGGQLIGRARPVVFRQDYERRIVEVVGASTTPEPFDHVDEIRAFDSDRGQLTLGKERLRCYVRPDQVPKVVAVGVSARVVGRLFAPIVGKPFVLVDRDIEGPAVATDEGDEESA
jgi:hypothetical protein